MAWSESVDPNYPEIRMETYKSNDPEYKEYNRTHYYDIPTRQHLGCIYEGDGKGKEFQELLNRHKEIVKMNSRFSSFDSVAKMYADIVPLRGARKAEDVRPIWNRRYSWRRVVKINDNKYILHDGDYIVGQRTFEESCDLAPITWERKADGDYITVRNCHAPYYSMSRYAFLSSALPRTMWFKIDNGKHYIVHGGKEHYLAKFKAHYDSNVGKHIVDKDLTITFKAHADGTFERVSELLPMRIRRMNKDLKVKYDPMIKDMWDWACMVLPILGETMHDWNVRSAHAEKVSGGSAWYWDKSTDPKKIREIVEDPEHELRLSLVAIASWTAGAFNEGSKAYTDKTFAPSKDTFREFKKVMRKVIDISAVELR